MKRKLFSLLVLLVAAVTGAWADIIPTYNLSVGTNDHGTVKFYVNETEVNTAAEGATVTVVITPNTGWVVNQTSGQWYAAIEAAKAPKRAQSNIDMLKDFELTKLLGQDNTWSFVMQRANAEISVSYKKLLTNTDITIEDITALTYSGVALTPDVTVKDGSTVLTLGTDYNVAYSNNTNAALSTATENAPTVTITAVSTSEKYAGETTKTFTINKKAMEDGFIANIASLVYNGVAQEPAPVVTFNGMTLVKGTDYSVSYENNVNVGTATVTCTGQGNYSGQAQKTFTITKKALTVTADNKSVTFGDDAPQYTVSYDGFVNNETNAVLGGTLAFACDYVKNQSGAGNYDITPSGLTSSNYDITFTKGTLTVGKKALENGFIADIASLVYNGVAQEPAPVVTFNGMMLVKGTDYSVSYENNVNVGTATATVTALANSTKYSGSASKTFTITKKALTVTADNKSVTFGDDAPTYTESYDGFVNNETKAVLSGTLSLTCSYVKNQTGAGNYDITPSGYTSSNYDITFTKGTLTVGKKALEDGFIANIASLVYNGVAQEPAPVVTFNGMTLVKGTDYSVSYENNVNVGTATATVTALANSTKYSGTASKTFTITTAALTVTADNKSVTYGDDAPTYTVSYDGFVNNETNAVLGGTLALACDYVKDQSGVGNYTITPSGYTSDNYAITFTNGTLTVGTKALENSFIATISSLVYNGQAQEPAPVLTFHEMTLAAGTDYTLAYTANTNAGTATVTCTGQGNYSGQAQKTFTITQKEATLQWSNTELDWTGQALKPTCEVTNLCGTDQCEVTVDGAQVDAGTYTATATALANANYKLPQAVTCEYSITKKIEDDTVDPIAGNVKAEVYDETTKQAVITEMTPTEGETTYTIPATIGGYDVVAVTGNLNKAKGITDIYLPAAVVQVDDANLQTASGRARVHAPIQSLGSYAAMLPDHVGEQKVMSEVKQNAQRYWTFSCDVDVLLPEGLEINYIKARSASEVTKVVVNADKIPANNGVMLIGEQGVTYTFVALETTSTGGDYAGNMLEPVLTDTHYAYASGYYVLKNGQFHAIANDAAQIPACKAVLHLSGAAGARVLNIVDSDATGVESVELRTENGEFATAAWYTLDGRKLNAKPTTKGMYILNGKKVIVK